MYLALTRASGSKIGPQQTRDDIACNTEETNAVERNCFEVLNGEELYIHVHVHVYFTYMCTCTCTSCTCTFAYVNTITH